MKFARIMSVAIVLAFIAASHAAEPAADAPRAGKYKIYVYGRSPGSKYMTALYNGYFVLAADGTYKAYLPGDKLSGDGKYSFKASTHTVSWDSGPYAGNWDGDFTIEREGKTHKIRMKKNTVASNSSDAPPEAPATAPTPNK